MPQLVAGMALRVAGGGVVSEFFKKLGGSDEEKQKAASSSLLDGLMNKFNPLAMASPGAANLTDMISSGK
jgi:hypothetical protein